MDEGEAHFYSHKPKHLNRHTLNHNYYCPISQGFNNQLLKCFKLKNILSPQGESRMKHYGLWIKPH